MRALALGCALLATAAWALPPQTWVIALGHNDGAPGDMSLLYAERDSRELADALRLHGKVSSTRTRVVVGEDAAAVRKTLLEVNAEIRTHAQSGPTALVVFYSGHADAASLHLGSSELPFDELKALVEGSAAGVRLLIVDACRSGALTRVKGVAPAPNFAIDLKQEEGTEGFAIITSSAAGESSQESDRLRGSFFTHHLVNALRGAADANSDGAVTLGEAYAYTYSQTLRSSGNTAALQHPTYAYDVKGRGDLILSTPQDAQGRLGKIRLGDPSLHLVTEDRAGGTVVAEVAPQGDRRELVLPARKYFVQQRKNAEFREYEVTLEPGQLVELETLPYRAVQYDRLVRQRGGTQSFVHYVLVGGGARGAILQGASVGPQVQLGYGLDLSWASVGARFRALTASGLSTDGSVPRRDLEFGLGAVIARNVDLPVVTLGFGLLIEGVYYRQTFTTTRVAPDRSAFGASFAGLLSAETHLAKGFALRVEGGPQANLFPISRVDEQGKQLPAQTGNAISWFATGALVWRP